VKRFNDRQLTKFPWDSIAVERPPAAASGVPA
jgi:hypothetical protein